MWLYYNDQFIPESEARIALNDRGFTLADGVFDTQIAVDGVFFDRADLHFQRLRRDAAVLYIPLKYTVDDLARIGGELLKKNGFEKGRYVVRSTLTRGPGQRGLKIPDPVQPSFIMRAMPVPDASAMPPVHAIIAQTVRRNDLSPLSRIKSMNYGDHILALIEAQSKGANEAILLNTEGFITCATTSNVFIREGQRLITPPVSDGVLPGITRHGLIERGAREESITPERLKNADEILLTNSVSEVRVVHTLMD